jgi:hypothetical protein
MTTIQAAAIRIISAGMFLALAGFPICAQMESAKLKKEDSSVYDELAKLRRRRPRAAIRWRTIRKRWKLAPTCSLSTAPSATGPRRKAAGKRQVCAPSLYGEPRPERFSGS